MLILLLLAFSKRTHAYLTRRARSCNSKSLGEILLLRYLRRSQAFGQVFALVGAPEIDVGPKLFHASDMSRRENRIDHAQTGITWGMTP